MCESIGSNPVSNPFQQSNSPLALAMAWSGNGQSGALSLSGGDASTATNPAPQRPHHHHHHHHHPMGQGGGQMGGPLGRMLGQCLGDIAHGLEGNGCPGPLGGMSPLGGTSGGCGGYLPGQRPGALNPFNGLGSGTNQGSFALAVAFS